MDVRNIINLPLQITIRSFVASTLLFSHLAFISTAYAAPNGGVVVGGRGTINAAGLKTTINQATRNMAIDWQSYNVKQNERVQYIQPNRRSISLNRIIGNNASTIQGQIDANGQIILVNPNGIFFSPTATINVGGIMASGLDIKPGDFLNGNYIFNEVTGADGVVINSGIINAATGNSGDGANVTLLGKQVKNNGMISAKLGSVNLAAGKQAVVTFDNTGLLGIKVTKEVLQNEIGIDPAVLNNGVINAEGGRILLSASVSKDVFSKAVNTGNLEQATSVVVNADGTFTLGGGADVVNKGMLNVSAQENAGDIVVIGNNVSSSGAIKADTDKGEAGVIELHATDTVLLTENSITSASANSAGVGGKIKILGNKAGLFDSSKVNASGENGGGEILIGGDIRGTNKNIRNAEFVYIDDGVSVNVDAVSSGDGGKLIAFATDTTRIYGGLFARGGSNSGKGGFIETSGLVGFDIANAPNVSSSNGQGGEWLIDPYDITIVNSTGSNNNYSTNPSNSGEFKNNGGVVTSSGDSATIKVKTITDALKNGDVTIETGSGTTTQLGDIIFETNILYTDNNNTQLTLNAANDINTSGNDITSNDGKLDLVFNAGGNIDISGSAIDTRGGVFIAKGVDFTLNETNRGGSLKTGNSNIDLTMTGAVNINGSVNTNNGYFWVRDSLYYISNATGSITTNNGNVTIETQGAIVSGGQINAGNGSVAFNAPANILVFDNITTTGSSGTLSFTTDGLILADNANLVIGGTANFNTKGSNAINLGGANDFKGKVSLTNGSGSVVVNDINDINFAASNVGSGSLQVTAGGNISQTGGVSPITQLADTTTSASFTAGGSILLNDAANDFTNSVSLNTTATGNVSIRNTGAIDFAASKLGSGGLTVNVTGITQSGAITQAASAGTVTLNAGTAAINLANIANDFTGTVLLNNNGANDVTITDANSITLGASSVGQNLTVRAVTGDINEVTSGSGLNIGGGLASFNVAAGQSIRLGNSNNNFSSLSLNNSGTGFADITLWRNSAIDLPALNLSGNLDVNAAGTITNTAGGLVVAGSTTLNASNGSAQDITLNANDNNFNTVTVNLANNFTIKDTNAITLSGLNLSGDLTVDTQGNISQSINNIIMNFGTTARLNAGTGSINLNTASGNDFKNIVLTAGGAASVSDINGITIGDAANTASSIGGAFSVTTNGDINQTAAITMGSNTIADFNAGNGQINLGGFDNNFSTLNLASSNNVNIKDVGSAGLTLDKINITGSGSLTINSDGAINDNGSGITVAGLTTLDAANNAIDLNNGVNDFAQVTVSNAASLAVSDANALVLGSLTLTGNGETLNVSSNGAITQTGTILSNGSSVINSGNGAINLNNNNNDFVAAVSLNNTTGNVIINDANDIVFAASSLGTGSFSVNAGRVSGGGITQTGAITQATGAGSVTLNAGTGVVTLNNSGNDFIGEMAITNSGAGNNVVIVDSSDVALAQSNIEADFNVTAGTNGDITQNNSDAGLTVAGTATLNVDGGRSIILGNTSNNINALSFNAKPNTGTSLQDVTIANNAALDLQTFNLTGGLNVNITGGGDITNSSGNMVVAGATTLNTTGDIDLSNGSNDFNSVNVTSANNFSITDINGIDFAGLNLTGDLSVAVNGNINQTAAVTMANNTTANIKAGSGQINLGGFNNNFGTLNLASSNNVTVKDVGSAGLVLGATTITGSGTLTINSDGAISTNGSGITVAGLTTLDAASNAISLNSGINDFSQISVTNATSLALTDNNSLLLGAINLTGTGTTLNLATNGALGQTTALLNNGDTIINTGAGSITLNNSNNDFTGTVSLTNTSGNVAISDANSIDFGASSLGAGSFTVNAGLSSGGGITQTGGAITQQANAAAVTLNAGAGGIALNNSANNFTGQIAMSNSGAGNNVEIVNSSDIALAQSSISGDLTLTAGVNSDITQNNNNNDAGLTVAGTTTFNVDGGRSVSMGNTKNDFNGLVFNAKIAGDKLNNITIADVNSLDLQTLNLTGDLTVTAGGNIDNTTGNMQVAGLTTLSAVNGDIDLTKGVNDFNQLLIKTANNVAVTESNSITIGDTPGNESSVNGDLALISNGDINQTAAITMQVGTTARFNAGSGSINLASQSTNDFKNIVLSAAGNVNLSDSNGIVIGDTNGSVSNIGGDLTLATQGNITQTAAITMTAGSTADFTAGSGLIDFGSLNNNFDRVNISSSNDVSIYDVSGGLSLGTTSITGIGSLTVTSTGAIRNDVGNIRVDGLTVINAGNNSVTLTNGSHSFNDMIINAGDVAINSNSAINFGDRRGAALPASSIIAGSLDITTNGDITDINSSSVLVGNAATLDAVTGNINLSNTDFQGVVAASAANTLSINDATNLSIAAINATDNVELISGGAINAQSGSIISNRVALTASKGIDAVTQTARLKADNLNGDVSIANQGDLVIESLKTSGDIRLDNNLDIRMGEGSVDADYDIGNLSMKTQNGSFYGLGNGDINNVDVTAFTAMFTASNGSFGTVARPIYLKVKESVYITTRRSIAPKMALPLPRLGITDVSTIKFDFVDVSNAAAGEQLITVEELEDIDPAIFSDVRNYSYGQVAIRLPRDQLFEDELKAMSEDNN